MKGLAPARVFADATPVIDGKPGFRRLSDAEIDWHTSQHFQDETIEPGGIITLPDKRRYYAGELLLISGERRECVRSRRDHSSITVLPAAGENRGERPIRAAERARVGNSGGEDLAAAHQLMGRARKAVGNYLNAGDREQGTGNREREIIPRSIDAIPARDLEEGPQPAVKSAASPVEELAGLAAAPDAPGLSIYDFEDVSVEEM